MAKDYYRVLGLADNAEDVVIRAAYRHLAHQCHPDKWPENTVQANRFMAEINEAYRHLSDPLLKAEYDGKLGRTVVTGSDYYRLLGVSDNADNQGIRTAYQALSKKYRRLPQRLYEIEKAYKTLSDPVKRKAYDFKQSAMLRASGLSLWKVYLVYNAVFYMLLAVILFLAVFY